MYSQEFSSILMLMSKESSYANSEIFHYHQFLSHACITSVNPITIGNEIENRSEGLMLQIRFDLTCNLTDSRVKETVRGNLLIIIFPRLAAPTRL